MKKDGVTQAKTALLQFIIGMLMTIVSVVFKSVILFLISIVVLGLGIKGFVNIFSEQTG